MPMQWNDQADARLFSNVLRIHVAKLDYHALAKAMGNGVTPKAISHRISKIKEKAKLYLRDHPYAFGPDYEEPRPMYAVAGSSGSIGLTSAKISRKVSRARAAQKAKQLNGANEPVVDDEEPGTKKHIMKSEYGHSFSIGSGPVMSSFVHGEIVEADEKPLMQIWSEENGREHGMRLPPMGNFYDFTRESSMVPGMGAVERVQNIMDGTYGLKIEQKLDGVKPEVLSTANDLDMSGMSMEMAVDETERYVTQPTVTPEPDRFEAQQEPIPEPETERYLTQESEHEPGIYEPEQEDEPEQEEQRPMGEEQKQEQMYEPEATAELEDEQDVHKYEQVAHKQTEQTEQELHHED